MTYRTRARRSRRSGPLRCDTCRGPLILLKVANGRRIPFNADPVTMPDSGFPDHAYPAYGSEAWNPHALIAELQTTKGLRLEAALERVKDLPWHRKHGCPPRGHRTEATRERETTVR